MNTALFPYPPTRANKPLARSTGRTGHATQHTARPALCPCLSRQWLPVSFQSALTLKRARHSVPSQGNGVGPERQRLTGQLSPRIAATQIHRAPITGSAA